MNKSEIIGIVLVILATVGVVVAVYSQKETGIIEILARAPEKGNFTPQELTAENGYILPVGEKVKLRIRNVDTVTHGFAIPELNVDVGEIKAGYVRLVEFTPEKAGVYPFYCTHWCSEFHLHMRGQLEITDR